MSSSKTVAELYGTIQLKPPESDGDLLSGVDMSIQFARLTDSQTLPTTLFHPWVLLLNSANNMIRIQQAEKNRPFVLCHYSCPLEEPPVQAVLKVRPVGPNRSVAMVNTAKKLMSQKLNYIYTNRVSIYIQLHISSAILRTALTRLDVRLAVPAGNSGRFGRILLPSGSSQQPMFGSVSLLKEGAVLLWNLMPLAAAASSSSSSSTLSSAGSKLKEDMVLNVDVDLTSPNVSLVNAEASVSPYKLCFKPILMLFIYFTHLFRLHSRRQARQ